MREFFRQVCVLAFLGSVPASAQVPPSPPSAAALEPDGSWRVNYADDGCHLQRHFGTASQEVTLDIAKSAGPDSLDILLIGGGVPKLAAHVQVDLRLDPEGRSQQFGAETIKVPGKSARLIGAYDVDAKLLATAPDSQTASFSVAGDLLFALDLKDLGRAFAALQPCYDDLLRGWQIDPAGVVRSFPASGAEVKAHRGNPGVVIAQRADIRPQAIEPDSWVSWKDYPSEALHSEVGGTVVVALTLNSSGRVDTCRVVVSSKVSSLDQKSCEVMSSRAHYTVSAPGDGKAVLPVAIERIRWIIPLTVP